MALSSNTANSLASQQSKAGPSGSTWVPTPEYGAGAGYNRQGNEPFMSPGPGGQSPYAPDPGAEAQKLAGDQLSTFNMNQALQSIQNAPQVAAMRRQSDYYGLLAQASKNAPSGGGGANYGKAAGIEQAILGLHQMQLGNDANTLNAQKKYAQDLFGNATGSYQQANKYLAHMQSLAKQTYGANIGTFGKAATAAKQSTNTQTMNYGEDAAARGAFGAAGTGSNLANIAKTGAKTMGEITAAKKSFVTDFKKQLESFANQKFQNRSDYEKAFATLIDKNSEIANALSNNDLARQMDDQRKQAAAVQAANASAAQGAQASQQAWANSMAALQYQAQQAGVDSGIAGMGPQGINWSGLNLQDPNVFAFMNAVTGGNLQKWFAAIPGNQSQNDQAAAAMRGSGRGAF